MLNAFTNVPRKQLGRTSMHLSPVGLGTWAIGGGKWIGAWGEQDDRHSIRAIHRAIDLGINWIDTAAVYGQGHAEEVVFQALRSVPNSQKPLIFTKCGQVWDPRNRSAPNRRIGQPASIRNEVEQSLLRLGLERIDLYQMHLPAEDGTSLEEYWGTLLELKAAGKVRYVGLSNHNVQQLRAAEVLGHVDSLQPPFSAIRREVAQAELTWCHENGTGVIVFSPMQSGLLTGKFTLKRALSLPEDDWRSRNPEYRSPKVEANLRLAEAMQSIAARRGASVGSIAIAWTLAWPGVTAAIVGARSSEQVDSWIDAMSMTLEIEEMQDIAAAIVRAGSGAGPALPPSMRSPANADVS